MVKMVGTYELPIVLGVTRACLGKKYQARIGGRPVLIGLPAVEWEKRSAPSLNAPDVLHLPGYRGTGLAIGRARNANGVIWGEVSQWNTATRQFLGAWVSTVSLEFTLQGGTFMYSDYLHGLGTPMGGSVDEFFDSVDDWFETFLVWTAIFTNQDTYYRDPLSTVDAAGERLTVRAIKPDGELSLPASAYRLTIFQRNVELLIERVFRRIVRLTNTGQKPSDARLLVRDAYIDLHRRRHRKAVIDAGAAAELVLSSWNAANGVLPRKGQLPTLGNVVKWTTANIPPSTRNDLVVVRNAAIHQNAIPSASVARRALQVAASIVDLIEPLPR